MKIHSHKINNLKNGLRSTIELSYKISLDEFLNNNPLADELFYIDLINENQKEQLKKLKSQVNFFNSELKEDATKKEINIWYSNCVLRDEFWFFTEYQSFLDERLEELKNKKEKIINTPTPIHPISVDENYNDTLIFKHSISDAIKEKLSQYKFYDFLQIEKRLNNEQIKKLESLLSQNDTPYSIALLNEIGYLDYFKKEYCQTNKDRDKILGIIFNVNERRIKGNINVLLKNSNENKETYTSHQHIEDIKDILKGLSKGL